MKQLFKLLSYARNLWPYYVGIVIFSILMSVTALALPFLLKEATDLVVDSVTNNRADITGALFIALLLFIFDLANTLFTNWGGYSLISLIVFKCQPENLFYFWKNTK